MAVLSATITLDEHGAISVKVDPPEVLGNKMLMYGLLEVAKENLQQHWSAAERKIQPASMDDVSKLRLVGGGN